MTPIYCPHCDLPIVADSHTHHPEGCGIDTDGCTCPLVHGWCCPKCNPETAA